MYVLLKTATYVECKAKYIQVYLYVHFNMIKEFEKLKYQCFTSFTMSNSIPIYVIFSFILSMIATILSLNGGLLTTIICIHNQYLVSINGQIKLSVCLTVCLYTLKPTIPPKTTSWSSVRINTMLGGFAAHPGCTNIHAASKLTTALIA